MPLPCGIVAFTVCGAGDVAGVGEALGSTSEDTMALLGEVSPAFVAHVEAWLHGAASDGAGPVDTSGAAMQVDTAAGAVDFGDALLVAVSSLQPADLAASSQDLVDRMAEVGEAWRLGVWLCYLCVMCCVLCCGVLRGLMLSVVCCVLCVVCCVD
jgi:hypothetical protein